MSKFTISRRNLQVVWFVLLAGLVSGLWIFTTTVAADNDSDEMPRSPQARDAIKQFDGAKRTADEEYDKKLKAARDVLAKGLDVALKTAMQKNDLEEAQRINASKGVLTGEDSSESDSPRGKKSFQSAKIQIVGRNQYESEFAAMFPRSKNLARHGIAASSSTTDGFDDAIVTLGGIRNRDVWCLKGGKGWYEAGWTDPPTGRYVLLFNRQSNGGDVWKNAVVEVNGKRAVTIENFRPPDLCIIDLGQPVSIESVRITIDGDWNPGLAGLEIHRTAVR